MKYNANMRSGTRKGFNRYAWRAAPPVGGKYPVVESKADLVRLQKQVKMRHVENGERTSDGDRLIDPNPVDVRWEREWINKNPHRLISVSDYVEQFNAKRHRQES